MTKHTEAFFSRYASDFAAIYGNGGGIVNGFVNNVFRRSMRLRFIRTIQECEPIAGKEILDVGCGPGHYSVALAQRGAAAVLGIDVAEGMLAISRQRAKEENVSDNCRFERMDALQGGIRQQFDYVFAMGFMDYVEDAQRAAKMLLSLARIKAMFSFPASGGILAWQRQLRYRRRCPLFLYSRQSIEDIFGGEPRIAITIERLHRDFFVIARKNQQG
jgi:SAM-dependent methyltransferase